jgi:tRNA-specific 2-thiouridylase
MSGGVDSSCAALLLKDMGAEVIGCTMKLLSFERELEAGGRACCSLSDVRDARSVAEKLDFDFLVFNFTRLFEEEVIRRFARAYLAGLTPNPCVECNRRLKFHHLFDRAEALGCEFIATGHYARIERGPDGLFSLKKALDPAKDQSYVLYSLTQRELSRLLFPLGGLAKAEARALCARRGLRTAQKKESQDICFAEKGGYAAFLEEELGLSAGPGDILDPEGKVIGRHKGVHRATIGQRRGLGLPGPRPLYVLGIDAKSNTITVGPQELLMSKGFLAGDLSFVSGEPPRGPLECAVKTRYRQREAPAAIEPLAGGVARVTFREPQSAAAPGQAAVFYQGDTVLGGGTVLRERP